MGNSPMRPLLTATTDRDALANALLTPASVANTDVREFVALCLRMPAAHLAWDMDDETASVIVLTDDPHRLKLARRLDLTLDQLAQLQRFLVLGEELCEQYGEDYVSDLNTRILAVVEAIENTPVPRAPTLH